MPRSPAETLDRTILAAGGAAAQADAFAVDTTAAAPAALAYTRSLLAGTRLELIASGGAVAFSTAANVVLATRATRGLAHFRRRFVRREFGRRLFRCCRVADALAGRGRSTGRCSSVRRPRGLRAAPPGSASGTPSAGGAERAGADRAPQYVRAEPENGCGAGCCCRRTDVLAINAGGPATSNFAADEFFSTAGNWTKTSATSVATKGVTNAAPAAVYQSQRIGTVTYTLPHLTAGATYTVRLHFAELYFSAAGKRVFNVSINGSGALAKLDVFAAAGGAFKALVEDVAATADASGRIVIAFSAVTNNPIINGLEVVTGSTGPTPTPTPTATPTPRGAPADVPQFHNDAMRTGWNSSETSLTTANVASSKFGLRQILNVDGLVLAQPLFIANYPVNGTNHNVLVVATEHNSVYAFDAKSGAVLWQHSFGPTQSSSADVGCPDIEPELGITSTPAIDRSTGTIYAVFSSKTASGTLTTNIGALDLGSGIVKIPAVRIVASATQSNGSIVSFNDTQNMQRASLLLANGSIYLGVGSHCDYGSTARSGWLMRYSESNLAQLAAFNTIEDGVSAGGTQLGSIWGAGFGPAADAAGNVYAVTGNGAFDASSGGHNFAMSVLKFAPSLAGGPVDWFAYKNEAADSDLDADFGSGGSMLLPVQSGSVPNVLV